MKFQPQSTFKSQSITFAGIYGIELQEISFYTNTINTINELIINEKAENFTNSKFKKILIKLLFNLKLNGDKKFRVFKKSKAKELVILYPVEITDTNKVTIEDIKNMFIKAVKVSNLKTVLDTKKFIKMLKKIK